MGLRERERGRMKPDDSICHSNWIFLKIYICMNSSTRSTINLVPREKPWERGWIHRWNIISVSTVGSYEGKCRYDVHVAYIKHVKQSSQKTTTGNYLLLYSNQAFFFSRRFQVSAKFYDHQMTCRPWIENRLITGGQGNGLWTQGGKGWRLLSQAEDIKCVTSLSQWGYNITFQGVINILPWVPEVPPPQAKTAYCMKSLWHPGCKYFCSSAIST